MRIGVAWVGAWLALLSLASGCDRFLEFSPRGPSREASVDGRGDGPVDAPGRVDRASPASDQAPPDRKAVADQTAHVDKRPLDRGVDKAPVIVDKEPVIVDKAPVIVDKAPVIVDKAPVIVDKAPVIVDKPALVDKPPAKNDVKPPAPAIVITEMMVNPNGNDPTGEWFELHNAGSTPVNLQGWTVTDDQGSFTIGSLVVNPGAYVVLGAGQADPSVAWTYTNTNCNIQVCMPNDNPDHLELKDSSGKQVDNVAYNTSWPYLPGASMSLRSPNLDNSNPSSWCTETTEYAGGKNKNKGTPGAPAGCGTP